MTLHHLLDVNYLVQHYGVAGVSAIIFAETGLLIGFFLPGDSLLVTAGILASTHKGVHINVAVLVPCVFVAAVLGAESGYLIGRRAGPALFSRPDSRLFKHEYVERTHEFFERKGPGAVVLARFVPVVRTFANPVAGMAEMNAGTFLLFNLIGAVVWSIGVTLLGYGLGSSVKHIDRYLLPIIAVIVVLSFVPILVEYQRARNRARAG